MSTEELIDLIPAYALGILDYAEAQQVETFLAANPHYRGEVASYRNVNDQLALAVAQAAPSLKTRTRLMTRTQTSLRKRNKVANHERFIREAYKLAQQAVDRGDEPFGALLVWRGEIALRADNTTVTERDATNHAETNLVRLANKKFDKAFLGECTLYTSTEPCLMCCGAIYWSGVRRIVYGVGATTLAALTGGVYVIESSEIFGRIKPPTQVIGPILEKEGMIIHNAFWPDFLANL
ncbi:MAG: deaminase [Candidatus Promineifilaceae bacterium]